MSVSFQKKWLPTIHTFPQCAAHALLMNFTKIIANFNYEPIFPMFHCGLWPISMKLANEKCTTK